MGILPMRSRLLLTGAFLLFAVCFAEAGPIERIGHTTLTPRHSNPDDKGMYAALIDPMNGYAYFIGSYLFKLDITGPLPVAVGPALNTGQFTSGAIDFASGYAYFAGGTIRRFGLGSGNNPVTAAGSLSLSVGTTNSLVIDDADPNPANHYAYALAPGSP